MNTEQPNFLFIFYDQQASDMLGYAGNPQVHTKNTNRPLCRNLHHLPNPNGLSIGPHLLHIPNLIHITLDPVELHPERTSLLVGYQKTKHTNIPTGDGRRERALHTAHR